MTAGRGCGRCQVDSVCVGIEEGKRFVVNLLANNENLRVHIESRGPAMWGTIEGHGFIGSRTEKFAEDLVAKLKRKIE